MYSVDYMYRNFFIKKRRTMLPDFFNADFWQEYLNNTSKYDDYFDKRYASFLYYTPIESDILDRIALDFKDSVDYHLTINEKRYSELYKVHVLSDDAYSITDNYILTEKESTDENKTGIEKIDKYSDDHNTTKGTETSSYIHKQSPYDNENFYNDTSDNTEYSERVDTMRDIYGERNKTNTNKNDVTRSLERKGNIGVKSTPEIIQEHKKLWTAEAFYDYIFANIAKEILLIGD